MRGWVSLLMVVVMFGCAMTPEEVGERLDQVRWLSQVEGKVEAGGLYLEGGREAVMRRVVEIGEEALEEVDRAIGIEEKVLISERARGRMAGMIEFLEGVE